MKATLVSILVTNGFFEARKVAVREKLKTMAPITIKSNTFQFTSAVNCCAISGTVRTSIVKAAQKAAAFLTVKYD